MKYSEINCGDINGKARSEYLPGALAANQDFFYLRDNKDYECDYINSPIYVFVSDEFKHDYKNNIFIHGDDAVVDAYDFGNLTKEERESAINSIINEKQMDFPEYQFEMKEGNFPIDILSNENSVPSTHILYIKNYKKHLVNPKEKSL